MSLLSKIFKPSNVKKATTAGKKILKSPATKIAGYGAAGAAAIGAVGAGSGIALRGVGSGIGSIRQGAGFTNSVDEINAQTRYAEALAKVPVGGGGQIYYPEAAPSQIDFTTVLVVGGVLAGVVYFMTKRK